MTTLSPEENLIVSVARATCFAFRFESGEVPQSDVGSYVDELLAVYERNPQAHLLQEEGGPRPETVASSVAFCAEQLDQVAPQLAQRLRLALVTNR
jgi:hypothetical protein